MTSQQLYITGAALMLVDAVAYSFGALRPLHKSLDPHDGYLSRRLLLNLMLANAGLYFTAIFAFAGAFAAGSQPPAGTAFMIVALAACLYSVATVLVLTPGDWPHIVPRALAALSIAIGLLR